MRALREMSGGLIVAVVSVLLVLGGISLSLAENQPDEPPTPTPLPPIIATSIELPTFTPIVVNTNTPEVATQTATQTFTASPSATLAVAAVCNPPTGWIQIIVSASDTLYTIAERYKTTAEILNTSNCLNNTIPAVGSRLYVPPVPTVTAPGFTIRNPIDSFILAKLQSKGLKPAPEADRRTLARRLSLDLTGLPPTPADVDAFVGNASPHAYQELVQNYMASPQWGEHRARYWLDAARYADTHGLHFDNYREMWPYRDWVIDAFNRNLSFDRFTVEQLAGDLLPNRTFEQQIASADAKQTG